MPKVGLRVVPPTDGTARATLAWDGWDVVHPTERLKAGHEAYAQALRDVYASPGEGLNLGPGTAPCESGTPASTAAAPAPQSRCQALVEDRALTAEAGDRLEEHERRHPHDPTACERPVPADVGDDQHITARNRSAPSAAASPCDT